MRLLSLSIIWCFLLMISINFSFAQKKTFNADYRLIGNGSVQAKNYYLLTLILNDQSVKHLLEVDTALSKLTALRTAKVKAALAMGNLGEIINSLEFSREEDQLVSARLLRLYASSAALRRLVNNSLTPSGTYILYKQISPAQQLGKAWECDATGMDTVLEVYGKGQKPHYPVIDSISFKVNDPAFLKQVKLIAQAAIDKTPQSNLFFSTSLNAALSLLDLNGRNDAGNDEPMAKTVNKAAFEKTKRVNWNNFKYSVLLVPGEGPETYNESISSGGIARCRLAADIYRHGLVPFILVSGGKVHPYKTKYCEAEEMKRYLTDTLQIPKDAVLLEPHARHTTTNIRNGVRLMIRYQFPVNKPGLIVTDKADNDYISGMAERCKIELGYMPYQLGKRISNTELEFFEKKEALQINSTEPLDP
jgi:hypothetical protein